MTPLLIFAKLPRPGEVMTRLCPPLMAEEAAAIQRACIRLLCERAFRCWPVRPTLMITPDDSEEAFREFVGPYMPIRGQGPGGLGERLSNCSAKAFKEGSDRVMVIGTDSPTMPQDRLAAAAAALDTSDVVVGECDDGGFYLLGLRSADAKLFRGIEWSTDRVAEQMRDGAKQCGLSSADLEPWYDIDRPADLERAVADMRRTDLRDDYELIKVIETALAAARAREVGSVR